MSNEHDYDYDDFGDVADVIDIIGRDDFENDMDDIPQNILDTFEGTMGIDGPRTSDDIGPSYDDGYSIDR